MRTSKDKNCLLWLRNHAKLTLKSYGIDLHDYLYKTPTLDDYRRAFKKVPREHIEFLASTKLWYESNRYLFVHAGVNPAESLADNDLYEQLWRREGLGRYKPGWSRCVVHGHTPVHRPRISKFEIALDSGAGSKGPLTTHDVRSGMNMFLMTQRFPKDTSEIWPVCNLILWLMTLLRLRYWL